MKSLRSGLNYFPWIFSPIFMWWVVCFPGYFSPDSTGIFLEVTKGPWDNWHTIAYVSWFWVTSLGGHFPSLVTLSQAVLISFTISTFVSSFEIRGRNEKWLKASLVVFGAMPQVGAFAITAWKDVPYAAFVLLLASTVPSWVRGDWSKAGTTGSWYLAIGAISAFRWNGAFMALSVVAIRLWLEGKKTFNLKRIGISTATVTLGFATLFLPVIAPSIQSVGWMFFNSGKLHDLAVLEAQDSLSNETQVILKSIMPLQAWREAGSNCHSHDQLLFKHFVDEAPGSYEGIFSNQSKLDRAWLKETTRNPTKIVQIRICRAESSLVPWSTGESLPPGLWYADNLDQKSLSQARFIPQLTDLFNSVNAYVSTQALPQWILLRAPVWILIVLGYRVAFHRRSVSELRRSLLSYLLIAISVCASAAVGSVAQDLRYTLPATIMLQLVILANLFRNRKTSEPNIREGTSRRGF